MTTLDGIPLFKGEAMLLSWGDTSSRGKTVTFALHPNECGDAHPFRDLGTGKHGQRFQIVAVPITDEGEPIPPGATTEAAIGSAAADHPPPPERSAVAPGGAYAKRAGILCNDPKFQAWMGTPDAEQTAERLRLQTGVHSRRDYDHDPDARRRFLNLETSYLSETGQIAERRR